MQFTQSAGRNPDLVFERTDRAASFQEGSRQTAHVSAEQFRQDPDAPTAQESVFPKVRFYHIFLVL